jgi:trimeric autotransporter adhesin
LSPSGLHLAVGAPNEDSIAVGIGGDQTSNSASASGAVYLFYKSGAWQQGAYIKASNSESNDHFGAAVALANDAKPLVVASPDEDSIATGVGGNPADNSLSSAGAVYSLRLP